LAAKAGYVREYVIGNYLSESIPLLVIDEGTHFCGTTQTLDKVIIPT
jgi:hypothetical protein